MVSLASAARPVDASLSEVMSTELTATGCGACAVVLPADGAVADGPARRAAGSPASAGPAVPLPGVSPRGAAPGRPVDEPGVPELSAEPVPPEEPAVSEAPDAGSSE